MPHQCSSCLFRGVACFSLPTPACRRIFSQIFRVPNPRLTGQPEITLEMPLLLRDFRKLGEAFRDLYDALLALALLPAARGNLYAHPGGAIEERSTVSHLGRLSVDGDSYQSAFASSSAFTASATSSAEPSRSSSSLHFHCAR